jgi:endonuclease YncB( thermonuclease family)
MRCIPALFAALFLPIAAHAETFAGQATGIDGDTLEIHGERIRMAGIDAPESRQACIALASVSGKASSCCLGTSERRTGRAAAGLSDRR